LGAGAIGRTGTGPGLGRTVRLIGTLGFFLLNQLANQQNKAQGPKEDEAHNDGNPGHGIVFILGSVWRQILFHFTSHLKN
jgi:hypothetical protein